MPNTWISTYAEPLATIGGAALVVVVTPLIGAAAYFRRKEYELVRKRYLEDGVDEIAKEVEYGLRVFEYNWAHSIHLLRAFRDLGIDTPPRLYESGFLPIDTPVSFEASRHYLLKDILDDKVFFEVHQLFTAFLHEADSLFRDDLCSAIRVSVEGGKGVTMKVTPQELFDTYVTEMAKKRKQAQRYYVLLGSLQMLSVALMQKHYTFKKLKKFRKDPSTQQIISTLKEYFKDELTKYSESPAT